MTNSGSLPGKVAIVVGASAGIGHAIALQLHECGATVHGLARRSFDAPFTTHSVDVTDPAAAGREIESIGEQDGIDILVLAAGRQVAERRLDQLDSAGWRALIAGNLDSAFNSLRPALSYLRAARGTVIALGSVSGVWPDLAGPAYQAAKLGLLGFIRAAAIEELPHGVRFSVVHPGMTNTDMLARRPHPVPEEIVRHTLAPEDVARVCVFIAQQAPGVAIPEVTVLPAALQVPGRTTPTPPKEVAT
jgi:NAD(P)-dependent dehydrogenase (short-subunit alcohol dehydrogenase family)